ncbi:polysaccharide pyruvyl transferase family protein [Vibrio diabolicus]|uniref:polysaccharide pyruvyl transferase family protein n=1 Tax=Vibrio harveyi group TaxID=717610 RepID=UPI001EEC1334|nr:polysaccharide pyruvyl transferase family protein [Vibrio alginolyticus]MCG6325590.1 polysaccharide pyruvyl transferase family protein [Vibrio alginolyticus]
MKKYIVISTYPKEGSKNIGDQLITNSVINAIKVTKGNSVNIDVVWRAQPWQDVKSLFLECDAVIFACLAIRPKMSETYPYLSEILKLDKEVHVVSAGTALVVESPTLSFKNYVDTDSVNTLIELDRKCKTFTTRGALTQSFCESIGMKNAQFGGDVAFVEKEYSDLKFKSNTSNIENIVMSDPHYAINYEKVFERAYYNLKQFFPEANIKIALHGNDPRIKDFAIKNKIEFVEIFKEKNSGLNIYDSADLHVGFRVHAHVSALKRRKYSYLFEQDGRGCDYGLTINRKISLPTFRHNPKALFSRFRGVVFSRLGLPFGGVKESTADLMLSLIKRDYETGFEKFVGLEKQFVQFSSNIESQLEMLP